jgi:hypothetical protein
VTATAADFSVLSRSKEQQPSVSSCAAAGAADDGTPTSACTKSELTPAAAAAAAALSPAAPAGLSSSLRPQPAGPARGAVSRTAAWQSTALLLQVLPESLLLLALTLPSMPAAAVV